MNIKTANRLLEYRKANGYSQEELAEKIGVSRQAISKWERSESSPDTDNLIALSRLYGVTIDELLNGSGEPKKAAGKSETPHGEPAEKTESEANPENDAPTDNCGGTAYADFNGIPNDSKSGGIHPHDGYKAYAESDDGTKPQTPPKSGWLNALLPSLAVCLYLLLGFTTDKGWAAGWILFLFIPIIETAVTAFKTKNPNRFSYPVLAAAIYLVFGMVFDVWHPTWIIFVTIPAYYALCDTYKKMCAGRGDDFSQYRSKNGAVYYSPENAEKAVFPKKHSNIAAIIITVICAVTIISIVAITCVFGFLDNHLDFGSDNFTSSGSVINYDNEKQYALGGAEVPAAEVSSVSVEWVAGDIDIQYYDGSTVSFSEPEQSNSDLVLRWAVSNGELRIKFCKSGLGSILKNFSKSLTIFLPRDFSLDKIDIESVSSNVDISSVSAIKTNIETVSGNCNLSGSISEVDFQSVSGNLNFTADSVPLSINIESVSGDANVAVPADISGFIIDYETISGDILADDFSIGKTTVHGSGNRVYGNGALEISYSGISGDFEIIKAE